MATTLIQSGTVIDPSQNLNGRADVLIENGRIARIGTELSPRAKVDHVIDAKDKLVVPGLIDIHVHFREPGDEEEETIAAGAAAAFFFYKGYIAPKKSGRERPLARRKRNVIIAPTVSAREIGGVLHIEF